MHTTWRFDHYLFPMGGKFDAHHFPYYIQKGNNILRLVGAMCTLDTLYWTAYCEQFRIHSRT